MATIQEMQKARELMKTQGLDLKTAVAQARTPVTPVATLTPVTPAPTAPAPIAPTVNVQEQMSGMNVAERQAIRSGTPAPVTTPAPVAPVSPNTPAPVQNVSDTAPITPKVDATPGITQDSFNQAKAESEKIKAQNEAQMKLNTQQADLKAQERQQVAQETAKANTPTDTQGILNSLVSGVLVAPQKSGNYINAKFQYDQYSKFNAMTPTQLLDNLKQGQIGTEMDKLLSQNSNYVQAKGELDKIQKTNNINNNIKTIYGGVTGQTTETPDYLGMVSNDLMTKLGLDKDMTSAEAFSQYVTGDQKIVDYTNQLSNVNRQIADTSKLINDGIKSLKAKKGDMPADALVVLLNSTFKDVNETLTNLNNTKTYLEADLKNASEMAFNRYNAVSKDIDNARTIKNSVISNLIQSQFNLAEKQTEADLANQIARESMNDPYKAIPTMIEEYKKLGIPFTRSTQQIIQDFESSGQDLPTYLSELQGTIQSKPEYQRVQDQQAGKGISYQTIGDSVYRQNADGSLTKTGISAKSAPTPVWQEWEDATGKHAGWVTPGVTPSTSTATAVKPTGNIVPVTAGNKTVRLDQSGAGGFESAINQLTTAGIPIVVGQGARDQSATIKEMADRYGIPFNASNPAETAGKLRKAGHQVADPGKSNHESGMAIDVYGDSKLGKVSTAQEKILNANGWYSAGIPGDAGHFEYRGGSTSTKATGSLANLAQFMKDNQDRGQGYSNDDVKAFNEKIDRLSNAGDENGMALAYRNMVMKDKDFKKDFDDTQKFATALDSVQKMVSDYEKAGKDTNALKKIAETVGRKLGVTTDTALAQLQTQMGVTMANYIKSISGTAASDAEVTRLMGNMANIGNVSDLNTAIISTVKDNALNGLKSMIDTRMYGMPEELKPQVFGDIYNTTQSNSKLSALMQALANIAKNAPKQ